MPLVGLGDGGDGHHPVHEGAGHDRVHVTDLAGLEAFLDGEETAAKTLGVADAGIQTFPGDGVEDLFGFPGLGGQRLFDKQFVALFDRQQRRLGMFVFLGDDHHRIDFGALDQLLGGRREEIRLGILRQLAAEGFVYVREAEPFHPRIFARILCADAANGAAADDCQADLIYRVSHAFNPLIRRLAPTPSGAGVPQNYCLRWINQSPDHMFHMGVISDWCVMRK